MSKRSRRNPDPPPRQEIKLDEAPAFYSGNYSIVLVYSTFDYSWIREPSKD